MSRLGAVRRREIVGFCLFDFANSSFTTLISTVAFARYFRTAVVGPDAPNGEFLWGLAAATSHVVLVLASPVLGAVADYSGRKKRGLLLTTVQTVVACALLFTVTPGNVALGMILFITAAIGFEAGYIFYNAFLADLSTPSTVGRISGWSWGTGFVGGLCALLVCKPLLSRPLIVASTGALDPTAVFHWRLSFLVVAGFFAVFSIPAFLFLRERGPRREPRSLRHYIGVGLRRVTDTAIHLRRNREVGKFVLAYLFFFGGIEAVIKFSAIYADVTFGIGPGELVTVFIVTNIIAVPGTIFAGYVADWLGGKRAIALTLVAWIALLSWGALTTSRTGFWILAGGIAIGMGSTQAIARSFMTRISPRERVSEFFGYYVQAGRLGSILALPLFGWVASSSGSQRLAVLWLIPMFVIGLCVVGLVNEDRALRDAGGTPHAAHD